MKMQMRIVVAKEGDIWVAHSVDHVLVTQGESVKQAVHEMVCAYVVRHQVGMVRKFDAFEGLKHSSSALEEKFEQGIELPSDEEVPAGVLMSQPAIAVRLMQ